MSLASRIPVSAIVVGFVAVAGGLGAGHAITDVVAASTEEAGEEEVVVDPDSLVAERLGETVVNLRGNAGARLVRMELEVSATQESMARIQQRLPVIKHRMIAAVADLRWEDVEGAAGKEALKEELHRQVDEAIAPARIHDLYFVDFVVQ